MLSPRCFAQPRHLSQPIYYPTVICSRAKRTSVTSSYINPGIRKLNAAVREAETAVIDEIDHLHAVTTIGEEHEKERKEPFYLSILLI
jgi:hypothetical protein